MEWGGGGVESSRQPLPFTTGSDKQYNDDIYVVFLLNSFLCDSCISKTTRKTFTLCLTLCYSFRDRSLPESIKWFTEGQSFSQFNDIAPHPGSHPPPPFRGRHTERLRKRNNLLTAGGGLGCARSRIIRPQESLVLHKSFNTLWPPLSHANWHCLHLPLSQCKCQTG